MMGQAIRLELNVVNSSLVDSTDTTSIQLNPSILAKRNVIKEETKQEISALVYPNPLLTSEQLLTIDIKNPNFGQIELTLYNAQDGHLVQRQTFDMKSIQTFIQFDLSKLPKGMYYLYIKGDAWVKTSKVIVK